VLNQGSATPVVPASISVFSIDTAHGLLTTVAGSPFPFASLVAPNPQFLIASPTSEAFYVSNGVSGTISGFVLGGNGVPSEVAGSPFATEAGATLAGMAIDPKGQIFFVADSVNNSIASFNVASSGALTVAAGSPVAAGTTPVAVAVDGTSGFLYSANQGSDDVSAYSISSGSLTPLAGSPFSLENSITSNAPAFITVDPSNAFLYVANPGTSNVTTFGRAADGTLQLTTDSPFPTTVKPQWIVITK
jgi:DNA-binding beta-propeller fold protein YncE